MSAEGISWIVSIAFILLLVVGFFIGMWRGWKRSLLNFCTSIIGIIVALFVTKPITSAIMGIKVSDNGGKITLTQFFVDKLRQNNDIALMMDANPSFRQFINGLPDALANTVVFLVVSSLIALVVYIVYKIACIGVKYRPAEKKHRLAGAGINAVKVFALSVFSLMPLMSLVGLANNLTERESYMVSTEASEQTGSPYGYIGEQIPEQAILAIRGVDNSLLGKICGIGGLDDKLFDYYANVKVDGESVNVREEVSSYYEVLAFKYDVENTTNLTFTNIDYDKFSKVVDKVVESPLFTKVVSSTLADMIINYKNYSFMQGLESEYGGILDNIGTSLKSYDTEGKDVSEYFSNDIKSALEIFKDLGRNGVIDDIKSLKKADADAIIQTLTDDTLKENRTQTNKACFDESLKNLFKMNTVRDAIAEILKKYSADLIDGLDTVGVDTSVWTEADWEGCAIDISSFAKNYADLTRQVKLADVLSDATIILDKDKNYDINSIMTSLGKLVDNARNIKLLRTSDDKPIFDKLLADNNIVLPEESEIIKNAEGEVVTINSYTKLFTFVSPSLEKLKSSGMYETINGEGNNKVKGIADIISQEGSENLLKEIILPLNQVEPTKSLIMNNLTSSLGGDFIDLSGLNTYEEWDKDLGYISSLLIVLNKTNMPDGATTYLDKILDDKTSEVFDNLTDSQVEGIIKPILYSKATTSLKSDIMNKIADECNKITKQSDTIDLTGVTLVEGDADDQANEICAVMKTLIALKDEKTETGEMKALKDMNEEKVKAMLTALQTNGYRKVQNATLKTDGAFKAIFKSVVNKFNEELSTYDEVCQAKYEMTTVKKIEAMCGQENYLQEQNYGNIDFYKVFEKLHELKEDIKSSISGS